MEGTIQVTEIKDMIHAIKGRRDLLGFASAVL